MEALDGSFSTKRRHTELSGSRNNSEDSSNTFEPPSGHVLECDVESETNGGGYQVLRGRPPAEDLILDWRKRHHGIIQMRPTDDSSIHEEKEATCALFFVGPKALEIRIGNAARDLQGSPAMDVDVFYEAFDL